MHPELSFPDLVWALQSSCVFLEIANKMLKLDITLFRADDEEEKMNYYAVCNLKGVKKEKKSQLSSSEAWD